MIPFGRSNGKLEDFKLLSLFIQPTQTKSIPFPNMNYLSVPNREAALKPNLQLSVVLSMYLAGKSKP